VSFEIKQGEVVGIVGRNGAGKSTMLKLLSRITDPTEGQAEIHGRVGSLLEVGTGFHPELTGRENIFLNGAILGMKRAEIARKFDEIVAFSEIEQFLDTPVKRYSSGMYTRLAFAVAAHLEPEVLIVDEVLAVGDAAFQRKCTGKMSDVARQGRTILFVSHNMGAMQQLCTRGILLRKGEMIEDGPIAQVVGNYLSAMNRAAGTEMDNPERSGTGAVRLEGAAVLDEAGQPSENLVAGKPMAFRFDYVNHAKVKRFDIGLTISTQQGVSISHLNTNYRAIAIDSPGASGRVFCRLPRLPLVPGRYRVAVAVAADNGTADWIPNVLSFDVAASVFFETGKTPNPSGSVCMIDHDWSFEPGR
jgi:lipopolysaccharide transport system ATP-binding protein